MLRVKASPDFIPHEEWDEYAWLLPPPRGNEPWYYAVKRRAQPSLRAPVPEASFLETVDTPLRELVSFLHQRDIPTGPSCAGHDISHEDFQSIYEGLLKDRRQVRQQGLLLWDPEAQRVVQFKQPKYDLPWDFRGFLKRAQAHQPIGWLPFYTDDPRAKEAVGSWPRFEVLQRGDGMFAVKTKEPSPHVWERATDIVIDALY